MNVNELRVAGEFEIPDARPGDEVDVVLRVRIYSLERDRIDVSTGQGTPVEMLPGGLIVQAVALPGWPEPAPIAPAPIAPNYADSAE